MNTLCSTGTLHQLFSAISGTGAYHAVKYESERLTVKLTRRHRPNKRSRTVEFVLTVGAPNYVEREFIRNCKRAGEPFPVRKIQLKHYPKARKSLRRT